jgi:putative nucleotidyltransferase-like protein
MTVAVGPASGKLLDPVTAATVDQQLLALIGGRAPQTSVPLGPEDSRELVVQLLDCWRILPALPASVVEGDLADVLADDDHARLRDCWVATSAFARAQWAGAKRALDAFESGGLEYSLLKGAAVAVRVYDGPHERASTDLDIGVRLRDIRAAERIARKAGYVPAQKNDATNRFEPADPRVRARVEAQHYELSFLVRRLGVSNLPAETLRAIRSYEWTRRIWLDAETDVPWCYTLLDVHHALSLDIEIDSLLRDARRVDVAGRRVVIPSDAWLALHLIFKVYWEGVHNYGKGLYQYADLVRLVPCLDERTFERLEHLLHRHGLVAAGHYVLRRLPLFGCELPAHVAAFVEATCEPPHMVSAGADPFRRGRYPDPFKHNDLGDMWPKLWGRR